MEDTTHQGLLNNLVTQFSSALDCFRELVQNSIDAGSSVVEVWTEYVGEDGQNGAIVAHVDDYGEGMDRMVIDRQFTRLFSSTKRRDLTKIGKFGIGFVSVFALNPQAVIVRTGKDGEYWEVFFHRDRSFQITALDEPVEGTQISIVLAGDISHYGKLAKDIRDSLKHWCVHARAEVGFEDRTPVDGSLPKREMINEPFVVDGLCAMTAEENTTEMAFAYSFEPVHSFFNRGLTLASGARATESLGDDQSRFGHITFKISSPLFEHTLTRETIITDDAFRRGVGQLKSAVEALFAPLVDLVEELVCRERWGLEEVETYQRYLQLILSEPEHLCGQLAERKVFRHVDGSALTAKEVYEIWERDGRVLLTESSSPLIERLVERGVPVIWGRPPRPGESPAEHGLVKRVIRRYFDQVAATSTKGTLWGLVRANSRSDRTRPITAAEDVYLTVEVDEETPAGMEEFLGAVTAQLERQGASFGRLATCRMVSIERDVPFFVVAPKLGSLMARPPQAVMKKKKRFELEAALNRDHRHVRMLRDLYATHPDLAMKMICRLLDLRGRGTKVSPDQLAQPSPMTLLAEAR